MSQSEPGTPAVSRAQRRTQAGFIFAICCLVLVGGLSFYGLHRLNRDNAWVEHTYQVMEGLDAFLSALANAETAQRGFVITGDTAYLETLDRNIEVTRRAAQEIQHLVADNPEQQNRMAELLPLLSQRFDSFQDLVNARKQDAAEGPVFRGMVETGLGLTRGIRGLIANMHADEEEFLRVRTRRAADSANEVQVGILACASFGCLFVALSMLAIRKDLLGRNAAEQRLREANESLEVRVSLRTAELQRLNRSLSHNERRFRALVEHSSDIVSLTDENHRLLYQSPRVRAVTGYGMHERLGQPALDYIHPDDQPRTPEFREALFGNPGKPVAVSWRGRHKDGHWIWFEGTATNMLHDPAVGAIVTNFRDVSQRKHDEAQLHAQLARLALLGQITRSISERQDVRSIFQVVIRTLEEEMPLDFCCICLKEEKATQLTVSCVGKRSEALALDLALTEQAHVDIGQNGLSHCMRGHMVYEEDLGILAFPFPERLARGGLGSMVAAPLMVESEVFGIVVAARRAASAFTSDECDFVRQVAEHVALATQQAQLMAALQAAYEDLRQSQQSALQRERLRAIGQMASGIAHDINNALSPVTLYLESIVEREISLSPESVDQLMVIRRGIDDVARTVARIREFARQRDESLDLKPTDLNELVKQVTQLTRARWRNMSQRGGVVIDLQSRLDPALPAVLGIEGEIRDALINLIFNAADAMPQGGELLVRTAVQGRFVGLEVIDQGFGMDEDTRRRCLEPFFTTKGERGTGLGLAMVYGAMQRHRGDIEIESAPGQGTTIRLLFEPAAAASLPATDIAAAARPPAAGVLTVAPMRLLVIDDDPLVLTALRLTLESDGHQVTVADGGAAGVAAFKAAQAEAKPFAVVMTDLGMPHVDGRQVAAAIKAAEPDTRVLLLTGWAERFASASEIPPHVDLVLGKPPKRAELREALRQLLLPPDVAAVG